MTAKNRAYRLWLVCPFFVQVYAPVLDIGHYNQVCLIEQLMM